MMAYWTFQMCLKELYVVKRLRRILYLTGWPSCYLHKTFRCLQDITWWLMALWYWLFGICSFQNKFTIALADLLSSSVVLLDIRTAH